MPTNNNTQIQNPTGAPTFMTLNELIEYIRTPKPTLYALTRQHKIPFYKFGRNLLFKREEIDQWLEQYRYETVQ